MRYVIISVQTPSSSRSYNGVEITILTKPSFWHKREDFPYECTKPLPEVKSDETENTVLKTTFTPQLKEVFNKKSPEIARQELMNITYTTKHRWFPRARDKKAKKTPMDREYL
ncbi:hypothetical protein Trydic_g106 [Trypoxylus dichotomus]